jgi:hypothetical protein
VRHGIDIGATRATGNARQFLSRVQLDPFSRSSPFGALLALAMLVLDSTAAAQTARTKEPVQHGSEPFFEILPRRVLTGLIHLPGLLVTEADTVLLIAQSRITRGDFDPSDVVVTRSNDQGKTWTAPVKLFASGKSGRIGYSCMLVEDRTTTPHTILAFYTVGPSKWKSHELIWHGRRSTDEGATWSEPYLVQNDGHAESKPSNGGHGFQFPNGRLIIPGRGHLLYSDDHGTSWKTSGTAETVETKVMALMNADGTDASAVYLITRKSTTYRIYGAFGERLIEQGDHSNVFTTQGRNPGLARYSTKRDGTANVLLMSGLHDMQNRVLSITYSLDEGRTWSARKAVDAAGWYSDLGVTRNKTIIAAYTVGFSADLKIARFNLPWVMAK